jgi:aryl-alcohol dehydrogenase-like predicted oxidoreductase
MHYRRMGKTGLKLSEIALGSSILYPENASSDLGIACIRRAFELGINTFDTADAYERGETERVLGEAIHDLPREQIVIATKCWFPVWPGPLGRGLSRKHIFEAAHASLRRLRTDYIDLYQAHKYDDETPIEETLAAFDLLVRQGKVLYVGCSNFSPEQLCDANHKASVPGVSRFDCIQSAYHMLAQEIESGILPLCREEGVGVIVYSPLARGMLTGKYKSGKIPAGSSVAAAPPEWRRRYFTARNLKLIQSLHQFAQARRFSLSEVALAWILRRSEITSCIIGAQTPKQVEENVKASAVRLSQKDLTKLDQILASSVERSAATA